jgi:phosphatidylserine/phosphatidylglycerophosphate/cardiolipin synthase-like enzyme
MNTNIKEAVAKLTPSKKDNSTNKKSASYNSKFKKLINGGPSKIRDFLGGCLSTALFNVLDEAINDKSYTIYAALYELRLNDLTNRLLKLGTRANLILANGTGKTPAAVKKPTAKSNYAKKGAKSADKLKDENIVARKILKNKINLFDRMVNTGQHFAHNKFVVFCKNNKPIKVLTGTTNWTPDGIFAQVNNSVIINNSQLAQQYLDEWNQIKKAGNEYPDSLLSFNKNPKVVSPQLRAWCNPLNNLLDLKDVEALLKNAKKGILFLLFNPGPANTVFNTILDLIQTRQDLFIRGIMNQDPGNTGKNPKHLVFFNLKDKKATNWNVILPKTIPDQFSFWYPDPSDGIVTIHSKSYVIDAFSDNPIVITGSNNGGPKASGKNDDNLVIIKDKKLATEYATNIMSVYSHYR